MGVGGYNASFWTGDIALEDDDPFPQELPSSLRAAMQFEGAVIQEAHPRE